MSQRGFTLVEVLVAASVIVVGLTAIATGLQHGVAAVEAGRRQTTALFLAEEKLEDVKAMALLNFAAVAGGAFAPENPVAGYPQYRRIVHVTPDPAGTANTVALRVTVAYGHAGSPATQPSSMVALATVLSRR
jgi:prepilin-type N-terminal cleavage/methylation domain-containing protein